MTVRTADRATRRLLVEIGAVRTGCGDPVALRSAWDAALLLVPVDAERSLVSLRGEGVVWVPVFTSTRELAGFGVLRGEGDREWEYLTIRGSRLLTVLDQTCPAAGLAVDPAGDAPMVLPARWWEVAGRG
jgi:hypothetical protein